MLLKGVVIVKVGLAKAKEEYDGITGGPCLRQVHEKGRPRHSAVRGNRKHFETGGFG